MHLPAATDISIPDISILERLQGGLVGAAVADCLAALGEMRSHPSQGRPWVQIDAWLHHTVSLPPSPQGHSFTQVVTAYSSPDPAAAAAAVGAAVATLPDRLNSPVAPVLALLPWFLTLDCHQPQVGQAAIAALTPNLEIQLSLWLGLHMIQASLAPDRPQPPLNSVIQYWQQHQPQPIRSMALADRTAHLWQAVAAGHPLPPSPLQPLAIAAHAPADYRLALLNQLRLPHPTPDSAVTASLMGLVIGLRQGLRAIPPTWRLAIDHQALPQRWNCREATLHQQSKQLAGLWSGLDLAALNQASLPPVT